MAFPSKWSGREGGPRTLLVAATGGHLAELVELQRRLPALQEGPVWFVPASAQREALLAAQEVVDAPEVLPRDVSALPRAVLAAHRVLSRYDVHRVVSTGAGVAIAAFAAASARGIPSHYLESAARVHAPSLTGRVLERMPGVHLWSQNDWQPRPGWGRAPSVFDGFTPVDRAPVLDRLRVVVTVGTHRYGFRRMVRAALDALPAGAEVLWQTGHTDVRDLALEARPLVPPLELAEALRRADVVVAHAGVGSALEALGAGCLPLLVPRRADHDEHVDDHQVELARQLAARGLAIAVEPEQITPAALLAAARRRVRRVPGAQDELHLRRARRW